MTDKVASLVRRLRTMAGIGWNPIGDEAADRIVALETALRLIKNPGEVTSVEELSRIASEALENRQ